MITRVLHHPDLSALEAYLRKNADGSMMLRGNLARDGIAEDVYAGAFDRAGALCAVVAHPRRYGTLLMHADADEGLDAALRCALDASGRPARGLIGARSHVQRARKVLGLDGAGVRYEESEGLYALDLGRLREPAALRDGALALRALHPNDAELFIEWRAAYEVEALGDTDTPSLRIRARDAFERALEAQERCLLTLNAVACATTRFNARLPDMVQVGRVYTPPQARGRGYARAAVALSLIEAREHGVRRAILFTGEQNRPAIAAYRALGFERIADHMIVLLR